MNVIESLKKYKFISILRNVSPEYSADVIKALYDGGVRIFEVTFNPSKDNTIEDTQKIIKDIYSLYGNTVVAGAGTVITMEFAEAAYDAGAKFLVSPCTSKSIIDFAKEHNIISIPGAYTPNEILNAYNMGADIVKIFPVAPDEIGYLKNVLAPLSHIPFIPTGGVNVNTIKPFLDLGAVAVAAGASVFTKEMAESGDFETITKRAREHVEQI